MVDSRGCDRALSIGVHNVPQREHPEWVWVWVVCLFGSNASLFVGTSVCMLSVIHR
jgi:hypothetical protein